MLTNSLRIIDTTKTESFQLTFFQSDDKYDKTISVDNSAVFRTF